MKLADHGKHIECDVTMDCGSHSSGILRRNEARGMKVISKGNCKLATPLDPRAWGTSRRRLECVCEAECGSKTLLAQMIEMLAQMGVREIMNGDGNQFKVQNKSREGGSEWTWTGGSKEGVWTVQYKDREST